MKRFVIILLTASVFLSCSGNKPPNKLQIKQEIQTVLLEQVRGWNTGDITEYMQGYAKSDSIRFASGGSIVYGWQTVHDRYQKRYSDSAKMGRLYFSDIDITVLSPEAAMVFGKWQLDRENDKPWGLFTLLLRKTAVGWRIVHDHTSSAAK